MSRVGEVLRAIEELDAPLDELNGALHELLEELDNNPKIDSDVKNQIHEFYMALNTSDSIRLIHDLLTDYKEEIEGA